MKTGRPVSRRFFLRIEDLEVEIRTDVREYDRLVRFYLPSHVRENPGPKAPVMRIDVNRRRPETAEIPRDGQAFLQELRRHGLAWRADIAGHRATVAVDDRRRLSAGLLYHGGLLFPLSQLLLPFRSALIHGGLVSDGKTGILVVGASGAGKSTLTVSFNLAGYSCFTDEHVLIRKGRRSVLGGRLTSRVALPAVSMPNFEDDKAIFSWESGIGKYFLKPAAQNVPAGACRIKKVVFPRFTRTGRRRIRRLNPSDIFKRLLMDDYYYHSSDRLMSNGRAHLDLFTDLAGTAAGYTILYGPNDVRRLPEIIGELP